MITRRTCLVIFTTVSSSREEGSRKLRAKAWGTGKATERVERSRILASTQDEDRSGTEKSLDV